MYTSQYTVLVNTALTFLPILLGLFVAIPILLVGYILADMPCNQIYRTFGQYGNLTSDERKKLQGSLMKKFHAFFEDSSAVNAEKKQEEIDTINVWAVRLNMAESYDDIIYNIQQVSQVAFIGAAVSFILGFIISPFFILVAIFAALFGALYKQIYFSNMQSQVKKLNKSILFELNILATNCANILTTGKSVEEILSEYRPQAGAIARDIDLFLADVKGETYQVALTKMSSRIQVGDKFDEIAQFVDQLKSTADPITTSQTLLQLGERIYQTHIVEYIHGKRDTKMSFQNFFATLTIMAALCIYTSPSLIGMVEDMASVL